jgi:hypothetical protein
MASNEFAVVFSGTMAKNAKLPERALNPARHFNTRYRVILADSIEKE